MGVQFLIHVAGLRKAYNGLEALRGIDFEVRVGEVFGLLGPNGAGKTTTVEILEGLRQRSGGHVSVLGFDPGTQSRELKDRIGVCLQAGNLPDKIRVGEAIDLFGGLYSRREERRFLLRRLQIEEKEEAFFSTLSGGQKQRLALALALVNRPQVLFLDEPTAGLDPQARHAIHKLIEELREEQRTVVLTTHYIEEAEKLCDRVAIIDGGRIIALGTPQQIRASTLGHSVLDVRCDRSFPEFDLPRWIHAERTTFSQDRTAMTVLSAQPAPTLVEVVKWVDANGFNLLDVQLKRPTLEDVFIELTGRSLRE